jgi:hypothetical protein
MKERLARLALTSAALVGLTPASVGPVSATTAKEVWFIGNLIVPIGLGYPIITPLEHGTFTFSSDTCLKGSASSPDKPDTKAGVDPCTITAVGTIWGHCGLATGVGLLRIGNLSGTKSDIEVPITIELFGEELVIRGGGGNTTVSGITTTLRTTGSCEDGTATGSVITGSVTYVDIT